VLRSIRDVRYRRQLLSRCSRCRMLPINRRARRVRAGATVFEAAAECGFWGPQAGTHLRERRRPFVGSDSPMGRMAPVERRRSRLARLIYIQVASSNLIEATDADERKQTHLGAKIGPQRAVVGASGRKKSTRRPAWFGSLLSSRFVVGAFVFARSSGNKCCGRKRPTGATPLVQVCHTHLELWNKTLFTSQPTRIPEERGRRRRRQLWRPPNDRRRGAPRSRRANRRRRRK
jgi:hypothetical protein